MSALSLRFGFCRGWLFQPEMIPIEPDLVCASVGNSKRLVFHYSQHSQYHLIPEITLLRQ